MANAPLLGQDGGSDKVDLPDGASDLFFFEGLDRFLQPGGDLPVGLLCRSLRVKIALAAAANHLAGAAYLIAPRSGRSDRFLNIVHPMTGKVFGYLAAKNFRQLLVVALAKLAEGARCGDDDEIGNLAIQHPLVEQTGDSTGEAVFRGLAFIGICRTALMACTRPLVDVFDIRLGHGRQRWAGLVTGIAEQIKFFAVGDSHDCSLGDQHEFSRV
jgi:hypothetical protein